MLSLLLPALLLTPRPVVIDVHVHTTPKRTTLVADLLAANGISRFVNLSGGPADRGLAAALDAAAAHPGRIKVCTHVAWGTVGQPDFAARQVTLLERAKAMGAACLKVAKGLGLGIPDPRNPKALLAVDDQLLDPIWATAGRLGLPVFIHTGDPKAFFEPMGPDNERMAELGVHPEWSFHAPQFPRRAALLAARDRVVGRHRGTTFIGVHFANNPEDLDYVDRTLSAHPNLYVDIAARLPEIGRHDPAKVRAVFVRHQDRILFGTDLGITGGIMLGSVGRTRPGLPDVFLFYADHFRWFESAERRIPHPTPIQGDWTIDSANLPAEVLRKVYAGNALKLLWGQDASDTVDAEALWLAPEMAEFF